MTLLSKAISASIRSALRDSIRNCEVPTVAPRPPDTPVHEKEYPAEGVSKPGFGAT
jgi:hypothetical protein